MRKKLLYLVAFACSFSMSTMAQDEPATCTATEVVMTMTDSYGDGWDFGSAVVSDADGNEIYSGTVSATESIDTLCLADGVYSLVVGGSDYESEMSFTLGDLASGGAGTYNFIVGDVSILGCTDATALNFDALANEDDASCEYYSCDATTVSLVMTDSYSDGWDSGSLVIADSEGTEVFAGTVAGSTASADICLADGIYSITLGGSSYNTEMSFVLGDVASGSGSYGVPAIFEFLIGDLSGCTDGIAANFNALATIDDGSCEYVSGCTDPVADNWNSDATVDDGTCAYTLGCTDGSAINYDPAASQDDGSCNFATCLYTPAVFNMTTVAWGSEAGVQILDPNGQVLLDFPVGSFGDNTVSDDFDLCLSDELSYTAVLTDAYGDGWGAGAAFAISACEGLYIPVTSGLEGGLDSVSFTITDCSDMTFGCIDSIADNFNENATNSDGSCMIAGCMQDIFVEYNADATYTPEDAVCTVIVEGCTDATASNYNMDANTDDESCLFCADGNTLASVSVETYLGSWGSADYYNEWLLTDVVSGDTLGSGLSGAELDLCLSPCAEFSMTTLYGYSYWDGLAVALGDSAFVGATATSYIYGDCASYYGCMDPVATNYDAAALLEDDCLYETSIVCSDAITLENGDVYPGTDGVQSWFTFTLTEESLVAVTVSSSAEFFADTYSNCEASAVEGDVLAAGTYYVQVTPGFGANDAEFSVSLAAEAAVYGCMDPFANNFDANVNIDNEACDYVCTGIEASITANLVSYAAEVSWDLLDSQGQSVLSVSYSSGDNNSTVVTPLLCLTPGETYTFNAYDSYGDSWNGGTYSIESLTCLDSIAIVLANNGGGVPDDGEPGAGLESSEEFTVLACADMLMGCTDETAFNYNAIANQNDGSCIAVVYGCTDATAANFDATANTDDGNCLLSCVDVVVAINGGYSIGTAASWTLTDTDSVVVLSGSVTEYGIESTSDTVCVAEGTYAFNAFYNSTFSTSWSDDTYSVTTLCDPATYLLANNGGLAPDDGDSESFTVVSCDNAILGCTDYIAENYDATADYNDGSCTYILGCMDFTAFNYNQSATQDDESCVPVIVDCMDTTADNFNANANTEDNSLCVFGCQGQFVTVVVDQSANSYPSETAWVLANAAGDTIALGAGTSSNESVCLPEGDYVFNAYDNYGDGWNGGVYAITAACSEVQMLANNGGSTPSSTLSLVDGWALEGSESFQVIKCENMIFGCTDASALNFNAVANVLDDSCIPVILGCTDTDAANYDAGANTDDGTCVADCSDVYVSMTVGTYGSETEWSLSDDLGNIMLTGADVSSLDTICLGAGSYVFDAYDTYGDSWNGGTYEVSLVCDTNVIVLANNGGLSPDNGENTTADPELESTEIFQVLGCDAFVFGCTDSIAENFNALANIDDSTCEFIFGCTMDMATNYEVDATMNNDSCTFAVPNLISPLAGVTLDLSNDDTLNLAWETLWTNDGAHDDYYVFLSSNPNDLGSGEFTSDLDTYTGSAVAVLAITDSIGADVPYSILYDWFISNGYGVNDVVTLQWWISDVANYEGSNYVDGNYVYQYSLNDSAYASSHEINLTFTAVLGCMDETALNYDAELAVTLDDGSCIMPCTDEQVALSIDVTGGQYPGEISWAIYSNVDSSLVTSGGAPYSSEFPVCAEVGDYIIQAYDYYGDSWNGGTYSVSTSCTGISVDLANNGGAVPDNGNPAGAGSNELESSELFTASLCSDMAIGCMDPIASNYDSLANYAGVCDYVLGCTDASYAEFNDLATQDDGSCVTLACTGDIVSLNLVDSYGDSWNGGFITINGTEYTQSGSIASGVAESFEVCLDLDGCTDVVYTAGSYSGENSWSITNAGVVLVEAGNASATVGSSCAVVGCMDESANNYSSDATEDDGSCVYEGCTDVLADNHDLDATIDDGSCVYSCASGLGQVDVIVTTDNYSDETSFTLTTSAGDDFTVDLTNNNNTSVATSFCIENGATVSFSLSDSYGDGIVNGGYQIYVCEALILTNFSFSESIASEEFAVVCGDVYGCMDADALNYNEIATMSDDSCEYPFVCDGVIAQLVVTTGSFSYELGWSISNVDGVTASAAAGDYNDDNSQYMADVCLVDGADYSFTMTDDYGDGWGTGNFTLTADCGILAEGSLADGFSEVIDFTACGAVACAIPASWDVTVTGSNHSIFIPGDAAVTIDDVQVANGSALGLFFTNSSGDLQCAGYAVVSGETIQVAVMGDDTTTEEVDGLVAGEALTWMIWDGANCTEVAATAIYSGGAEDFTTNGVTFVESISSVPAGPSCQTIDIPAGWSMFSTYMIAADMDLAAVLAPVVANVIIAKDNGGNAYLVEWEYNGVGEMVVGQGYQIKTDAAVSVEICGDYAFPEDNSIDLTAGWNMIGYLRTEPSDAAAVLADINSTGNLTIAKDYAGNAYLPEWEYNGIGDMVPGQGYQLKTIDADVLTFLSNDESYRTSSLEVSINAVSHFEKVAATDNNMTVVIEDAAWDVLPTEGAEIAAFDKVGNLIGSAVYASPLTVLSVWGDDATTVTKDGLAIAENVTFKVWSNNQTASFEVSNWTEGSASYDVNAINVASAIVTNVLADVIAVERVLVKVINVLGQEVISNDESFKGEILFKVYNDGTVEKIVK